MFSSKMVVTKNWSERNQAEKLGIDIPKADIGYTKLLFYKRDVKRSFVDDEGYIILIMNDDSHMEIEYDDKIWKELQVYFKENDE